MLRVMHDSDAHGDVEHVEVVAAAATDLDELCRLAARDLVAVALEAERRAYLEAHAGERDAGGKQLVVGNGYAREREITTAAGRVEVQAPRVDDRRDGQRFTSAILPPYMRKSPKVTEVLPILYLRGLSTGDFAPTITVTARAHQNLVWTRQRQVNQLRDALRAYHPGALNAFGTDLSHREALAVLTKAPSPELGRRLSAAQLRAALQRAGGQRNLDKRAAQIRDALRAPQLTAPPPVADAYRDTAKALLGIITALSAQIAELKTALGERFEQHPNADILRSLPGLGLIQTARKLVPSRARHPSTCPRPRRDADQQLRCQPRRPGDRLHLQVALK